MTSSNSFVIPIAFALVNPVTLRLNTKHKNKIVKSYRFYLLHTRGLSYEEAFEECSLQHVLAFEKLLILEREISRLALKYPEVMELLLGLDLMW